MPAVVFWTMCRSRSGRGILFLRHLSHVPQPHVGPVDGYALMEKSWTSQLAHSHSRCASWPLILSQQWKWMRATRKCSGANLVGSRLLRHRVGRMHQPPWTLALVAQVHLQQHQKDSLHQGHPLPMSALHLAASDAIIAQSRDVHNATWPGQQVGPPCRPCGATSRNTPWDA